MKAFILFVSLVILVGCNENNQKTNQETVSITDSASLKKSFPEIYPSNPDQNSFNFDFIKKQSKYIEAFSSSEINKLQLNKASKKFISKYLTDCKLPFEQEIDEVHQFDYYFLTCKQTDEYFSFTFLSKSETIQSATVFLFVADLEKGHLLDCASIAEYFDYEGLVMNFELSFKDEKIVVNQHEAMHNDKGKLETKKQEIVCTINEALKITKDKGEEKKVPGKENAIFFEYNK